MAYCMNKPLPRFLSNFLSSNRFARATALALGLLAAPAALHANEVTYDIGGTFATSDWNNDSTNAVRTPGGPFSGYFTVDTNSYTVTALEIDTTFYSIVSGNVVVTSGTYNYGIGGSDDKFGTESGRNVNIAKPTLPLYIGLTTNLKGTASFDGRTGSLIQILDNRDGGSRIYRPRLSFFMENVDFRDGAPNLVAGEIRAQVWNVNRGTGTGGFSGSQSLTGTSAAVPEPATYAALFGLAALAAATVGRRRA